MFVMIGIIMSIALTCTLYTLAKQVLEYTELHDEAGWLAINYVWPPAVALARLSAKISRFKRQNIKFKVNCQT